MVFPDFNFEVSMHRGAKILRRSPGSAGVAVEV
jgi:hypothetical protein